MPTGRAFPFLQHQSCRTLTRLTLDHVPDDGTLGRKRRFRKSGQIWGPDHRADRIYFLERGQVDIVTVDRQGRELLLQVVTPPDAFGEVCLCVEEGGVRRSSAVATADTTVLEISYHLFLRYLQTSQSTLEALVCTFCVRLTDCETRTEVLAHRGADERLGGLLLQLAAKVAGPGQHRERIVVLHVSHHELARLAAMSRPHVTVTLGHFRRQRLVDYSRGRPLSVDVPALTAYLAGRTER